MVDYYYLKNYKIIIYLPNSIMNFIWWCIPVQQLDPTSSTCTSHTLSCTCTLNVRPPTMGHRGYGYYTWQFTICLSSISSYSLTPDRAYLGCFVLDKTKYKDNKWSFWKPKKKKKKKKNRFFCFPLRCENAKQDWKTQALELEKRVKKFFHK